MRALRFWKRRSLDRRLWPALLLALALLTLIPGWLALRAFQTPDTAVFRVPVWGWAHRGEWDYTVLLKPNTVYGETTAGPGLTYFDNLVEGIEARFVYTFTADTPAVVEGWYQITSELAAGDLPWERVEVVPRTPFMEEDGPNLALELALAIDRLAFLDRLNEMADEAGVEAGGEPTVTYTARVEVTAAGPEGETLQVLEPTLKVPLTGKEFTISGRQTLNKSGVIRRPEQRPTPGLPEWRRDTLVATGVVALLAPIFALVTRPGPRSVRSTEDALARQARAIRRKYRKRLAEAAPGKRKLPGAEAVTVAAMEDLARISDELLKTIVYRAPGAPRETGHLFYIVDGATRYEFRLSNP